VAASRARDQMWIVHSLSPRDDSSPTISAASFIEHAQDPAASCALWKEKEKRTQSTFEREVMKRLTTAGYRSLRSGESALFESI